MNNLEVIVLIYLPKVPPPMRIPTMNSAILRVLFAPMRIPTMNFIPTLTLSFITTCITIRIFSTTNFMTQLNVPQPEAATTQQFTNLTS